MNRGNERRRILDDDPARKRFVFLRAGYCSGLTLRALGAKIGGMGYSGVSDGVSHPQRDLLGRREFKRLKKKLVERCS